MGHTGGAILMDWRNKSDEEKSDYLLGLFWALTIAGGLTLLFVLLALALVYAPWPIKIVCLFSMVLEGLIVASLWYGTHPPR